MADIIVDGMTRVSFVPTIASASLVPTAAELTAGTILHDTLVAGGMEGFEASPGEVDNTSFASTFDTRLPGIAAFTGTRLILKKQDGTDTVHTTLTTFNTAGYIVIRDGTLAGTVWAATNKVQVYPVRTGSWSYMNRERNSVLRYWVATPVSAAPNLTAVAT